VQVEMLEGGKAEGWDIFRGGGWEGELVPGRDVVCLNEVS
jgi:hypothetical protein